MGSTGISRRIGTAWFLAGVYIAGASVLGAIGGITNNPRYWLVAFLLVLPSGIGALFLVYVDFGLIQAVGGLFLHTQTSDGSWPPWLQIADYVDITVLVTIAACVNVHLVRQLVAVRRRRRTAALG